MPNTTTHTRPHEWHTCECVMHALVFNGTRWAGAKGDGTGKDCCCWLPCCRRCQGESADASERVKFHYHCVVNRKSIFVGSYEMCVCECGIAAEREKARFVFRGVRRRFMCTRQYIINTCIIHAKCVEFSLRHYTKRSNKYA